MAAKAEVEAAAALRVEQETIALAISAQKSEEAKVQREIEAQRIKDAEIKYM
jgi:hypothetical protein